MKPGPILTAILASFCASSCQSISSLRAVQVEDPSLRAFGPLVVSASAPKKEDFRYNPVTRELELKASLLVRDTSDSAKLPLQIRGSQFHAADGEVFGAECKDFHGTTENIQLLPGQQIRLDCAIRVIATEKNGFSRDGTRGELRIPYNLKDRSQAVRMAYELPAEAFR